MTKTKPNFLKSRLAKFDYGKFLRYFGTSLGSILYTELFLVVLHAIVHLSSFNSNMIATATATLWVFPVSKHWIWKNEDPATLKRQIIPFWAMAVLGFVFSSGVVYETQKLSSSSVTLIISNLGAYGILWVLKFFVLDYIFKKSQ